METWGARCFEKNQRNRSSGDALSFFFFNVFIPSLVDS